MNKIETVRKMQEYIEEHYFEDITMSDLSKISFYSPWYSYRLFKEYVNMSYVDYLRRYRLSKSALELRDKRIKVIDIAFKYGYQSVDGYQRAFFKEFGMNPYEYLKNPVPICLFIPYKVFERKGDFETMKNVKSVFITVVEKPERKVIIKRGVKAKDYCEYCEEVGCDVWGVISSIKSISSEPVCLWLPEKFVKENTSVYVQGAEVEKGYNGVIPEGFDVIDLPASQYLMFQGEPFEEEDYEEAIMAIWDALKKYNPNAIGYEWDKDNPRIQLEPIGSRGYIELMAVKKINK